MNVLFVSIGPHSESDLKHSLETSKKVLPASCLANTLVKQESFPGVPCSWWYIIPTHAAKVLISQSTSPMTATLCYGRLTKSPGMSPAATIREAWEAEGQEGVRNLDGSFSAVIVDLLTGAVVILTDPIGRRSLRYVSANEWLTVSNCEVSLVGTGRCQLDYDLISAGASIACDWSLGGKSLLRSVQSCSPHRSLAWRKGRTEEQPISIEFAHIRASGVSRPEAEMVQCIQSQVRERVDDSEDVEVELTAGFDSRSILASLLSVLPPSRIVATTAGQPESIDVRVAQHIAADCGIRHVSRQPEFLSDEVFLQNCDVLALYRNGDTNSKRAFGPPLTPTDDDRVQFGGGAGGLFRGASYAWHLPLTTPEEITMTIDSVFRFRIDSLRWQDPSVPQSIQARLSRIVHSYFSTFGNAHDALDGFLLFERFGRWALGSRLPHEARKHSPFESIRLLELLFRLPAPIGMQCRLHQTLIRRYLGSSYWLPVNGHRLMALERPKNAACRFLGHYRSGRAVLSTTRHVLRKAYLRIRKRNGSIDSHALQQDLFSGRLTHLLRDVLISNGTFGESLLGKNELNNLISDHEQRLANNAQILGALLTLERWKAQVEYARSVTKSMHY